MERLNMLINELGLQAHPEGGFFAETYRSNERIIAGSLPERFNGDRSFSTAIYFLLPQGSFSAFHRIKSDECWHFYEGGSLEVFVIDARGDLQIIRLGGNLADGEKYQAVVPAGCWFASRSVVGTDYSLVGCTVAPGFDFADFELATADALAKEYPAHQQLIRELCR